MSFKVTKICRTCLGLDGILSIYEGKCFDKSMCIADMLKEIVNCEFNKYDGMPEKVCLACISEINRCYSFKIKCDNSNNTLKQLLKIPNESKLLTVSTEDNVNQINASEIKSIRYVYNAESPNEMEQKLAGFQDSKENSPEVIENNLEFNVEIEGEDTNFAFDSEENETCEEKVKSRTMLDDDQNSGDYSIIFTKFVKNTEDEESQLVEDISLKRSLSPTQCNSKATKFEYKCSMCPMTFVHNRNLIKHTAKIHKESEISFNEDNTHDSKNECVMMDVSKYDGGGSDYEELQIQREIMNKDNDQQYHMQIIELEEHAEKEILEQNQVEKPANELRCPHCSALFAMNSSLNIHIKMNKCTKPQFSCEECQKVFISQHSLKEHLKTHNFFCEICGENSNNKQEFDQHCADHQGINPKHQCPDCKKVFTMRSTLNDHMRIHTGEKPFVCDVCGKAFNQNANLKQHVMRHNKTKPFSCDQCDHSFVSKGELYAHLRTHSGDQPFRCDTCPSAFTTSSSLVKHKRIHTGERPYSCDFCPMRFTALNTLKNHRRTHTGEKPFKCKFCPRAFSQKSDCSIHMRTHTGERRHTCDICKMKFQQSGTLRTHMKTHKNFWNKQNNVQCVSQTYPDRINSDRDRNITKKKELLHIKTTAFCPEDEKDIGRNDLLHFNIEECASKNGDFNEEEC